MPRYRTNIIDSDGRFKNALHLDFADDGEAIETTKRLVQGDNAELWEGSRKIATFKSGKERL
jgi:hypothetical protein